MEENLELSLKKAILYFDIDKATTLINEICDGVGSSAIKLTRKEDGLLTDLMGKFTAYHTQMYESCTV